MAEFKGSKQKSEKGIITKADVRWYRHYRQCKIQQQFDKFSDEPGVDIHEVLFYFKLTSVKDRLHDPMKSPLSSLIILIAFVSLSRTTNDNVV